MNFFESVKIIFDLFSYLPNAMNNEITIERQWLYDQIWKRPATKIAADLGISSSALKKICNAMAIPTPAAGHWVKIEVGKKVKTPELPAANDGTKLSWKIDHKNSSSQKSQKQRVAQIRETLTQLPAVTISTDLDKLHPLVISTRSQIRENAKNLAWDERKDRRRLNAQVSIASLDRTCLFLDSVVRAFETAGYKFRSAQDGKKLKQRSSRYEDRDEPSGICWIEADDEKIEFWLREKKQRVYLPEEKQSWHKNYDEVPSGMLECVLGGAYHRGGRTNWRDGKIQKIEQLIPMMVAEIPIIAKAKKVARDQQARRERRWKYERELWDFEYHRKRLQEDAIKNIIEHASKHQSANIVRQYFEAVKSQFCSQQNTAEPNDNMKAWIQSVEQAIAAMDPVESSRLPWEGGSFVAMMENLSLEPPSPPSDYDED